MGDSMILDRGLERELLSEKKKEERLARFEEIETRVFERASEILLDALAFNQVGEFQPEPPPEWVEQMGEEAANRKFQLARVMWKPANMAPAGVALAQKAHTGISRARGMNKVSNTQNNLNVVIKLPAPTSAAHPGPDDVYPVRELEET